EGVYWSKSVHDLFNRRGESSKNDENYIYKINNNQRIHQNQNLLRTRTKLLFGSKTCCSAVSPDMSPPNKHLFSLETRLDTETITGKQEGVVLPFVLGSGVWSFVLGSEPVELEEFY
ncbi:hypothetical protein XENORESO_018210, partial [Xenotaenia resolanae]